MSFTDGLGERPLEALIEELFTTVPMHVNEQATWDGLPDHIIATCGRDIQNNHEYVLIANWLTKDRISIYRPMLDSEGDNDWESVFPDANGSPLFRVRMEDMLSRPYSFIVSGGERASTIATNFEIFAGQLGMWGLYLDGDDGDVMLALTDAGTLEYENLASEITEAVEFEHLLKVPELSPDAFITE